MDIIEYLQINKVDALGSLLGIFSIWIMVGVLVSEAIKRF